MAGYIFGQGHGAEQSAGLVGDAPALAHGFLFAGAGLGETGAIVENVPCTGRDQSQHVLEQGALAAAAAAHDDEYIAAVDIEVEVALDHEAAIGHGDIADLDMYFRALRPSDTQLLEQDIDRGVGHDQVDDGGDHCLGSGLAHRGRAAAGVDAGAAAGDGDEHGENHALEQAHHIWVMRKRLGPG